MSESIKNLGYATVEQIKDYYPDTTSGDMCWNCKHFQKVDAVTAEEITVGDKKLIICNLEGWCRKNPPTAKLDDEGDSVGANWPWVNGKDWCGSIETYSEWVKAEHMADPNW